MATSPCYCVIATYACTCYLCVIYNLADDAFSCFFGSESWLVSTVSWVNGKVFQHPSFASSMGYGTIL